MKSALGKYLFVILIFTTVLCFFIGIASASQIFGGSARADASTEMTLSRITSGSKFNNADYKNSYKVKADEIASFTANGGERDGFILANAFDTADRTSWISNQGNTDSFTNHVIVNLNEVIYFQSLTFASCYYTVGGVRNFSGYPTHLKVYAANGSDEFSLVGECESTPQKDFSENVAFTLPSKVKCDKIKIEFVKVSVYADKFDGAAVAATMDISLFKPELIDREENTLDDTAISVYRIPTSMFTYEANCTPAGSDVLENAFDGNWGTGWAAGKDNVGDHMSAITVTFDKAVTIDRIAYRCYDNRVGYGYPTKLKVYIANGGELSLYGECTSTATSDTVIFRLTDTVTITKLKFEYAEVCRDHKYQATAKEIAFLQPENEDVVKVLNMFSDYSEHTVKDEYNSVDRITALRESVKNIVSYESALKAILDRAEGCVNKLITKDVHREFQTSPTARNPINQYGDMASYARNEMLLNSIGTNRQVIGIGGVTGEQITVYVEAEEGDPLPQLVFTQIYGAWNSWARWVNLKPGKNVFTFPNLKGGGSYTVPINAGGPIHIVNPYTPENQSSNVKLYFEGGYIYPVFHDGDDETTFKMILKDYYDKLKDEENSSITIDAYEAVSDSIILSCPASRAYEGYITQGLSPQLNIDRWNLYIRKLLSFGGVECVDTSSPFYNEKNKHITINYRAVQPYAGFYAFAASEHIGIPDAGTHRQMVMKDIPGWAFSHEFGHTVDLRGRIWGEVSNNMWAIYDRYMIEQTYDDRISLGQVSGKLASDFSSSKDSLWNFGNCTFWYMIEGGHPGYWAGSENNYRYEYKNLQKTDPEAAELILKLKSTEKMIYFGSLAADDDLREYFERWGFYMNGDDLFNAENRWSRSKQTDDLKALMQKAIAAGRIRGTGKKYWYVDINQYRYLAQHDERLGEWASCYSGSDVVQIKNVINVGNSFTLLLPTPANQKAHLGYEIQSKINGEWKVMGFTYNSSFNDDYNYEGKMPTYRVVAYDRTLNHSGVSSEKTAQPSSESDVCRIGEVHYDTLKEAVEAAQSGQTIVLLKSCYAGGIRYSHKKIAICPENGITEDLVITKSSSGPIFYLETDAYKYDTSLQIGNTSAQGARIVLDGNEFYQSGSLIHSLWSDVSLNNVLLRNNHTSGNGGGIYVGMETTLRMKSVTIENNVGANGGGMYMDGRTRVHLNGVTIRNNTATNRGGGVYITENLGGARLTNENNKDSENHITNNTAATLGGGIYAENAIELFGLDISGNTAATAGGGIYFNTIYGRGNLGMTSCSIQGNTSPTGSAIYMNRGKVYLNGGTYKGNIYKVLGKTDKPELYLNQALPDFDGAQFELASIDAAGTVLIENITNLTLTQENVDTFKIKNGHGELTENSVVAKLNYVTMTVNDKDGKLIYSFNCPMGKFTLPECIKEYSEKDYFSDWAIGGHSYNAGDEITVTEDFTAQATVKKYCVVTINYADSSEIKYFKQGDVFYIPINTPDGEPVLGFECVENGEYYIYADPAEITGDMTFNAILRRMVRLTLVIGDEQSVTAYEYNRTVVLTAPQAPEGETFKHWLIDGKEYAEGDGVTLTKDITATAVFSDMCTVEICVGEKVTTLELRSHTVYKLELPEDKENEIFVHWLIDGVEYLAGADYVVTKDVKITAIYAAAPGIDGPNQGDTEIKPTQLTVTLSYGTVNEDGTEQQVEDKKTVNFGTDFLLPKPNVAEGKVFLYWKINGVKYNALSTIRVTQDVTAIAEIVSADSLKGMEFEFIIKNVNGEGEEEISRYQYTAKLGEEIELQLPEQTPDGYKFEYYLVDGKKVEAGNKVTLGVDTEIKAVYSLASTTEEPSAEPAEEKKSSHKVLIIVIVSIAVVILVLAVVAVVVIMRSRRNRY